MSAIDRIADALEQIAATLSHIGAAKATDEHPAVWWVHEYDAETQRSYSREPVSGRIHPSDMEQLINARGGWVDPWATLRERIASRPPSVDDLGECLPDGSSAGPDELQNGRDGNPEDSVVELGEVAVAVEPTSVGDADGQRQAAPLGRVDDQLGHGDSSRCAGADTPTERSVEVAADSAAGPAGAPLVPGRTRAGGAR